ncbi:carboxylesterase family protein-like protein, partial [Aureobasidium melanogenum]
MDARICGSVFLESRTREPAHSAQSVVQGHIDNTARIVHLGSLQQAGRVSTARLRTSCVSTSIDPDQNGVLFIGIENGFRNHNIEEEAIFGLTGISHGSRRRVAAGSGQQIFRYPLCGNGIPCWIGLRADTVDTSCLHLRSVYSRSLRSCETKVADWRSGITNVGEVVAMVYTNLSSEQTQLLTSQVWLLLSEERGHPCFSAVKSKWSKRMLGLDKRMVKE